MNTKAQQKPVKKILESDDSFEILKNLKRAQEYHAQEMEKFQAKYQEHNAEYRMVVKAIKIYERKTGDRPYLDIPWKEEIVRIFKSKGIKLTAAEVSEMVMNKYKIVGKGRSDERAGVRSAIYVQLGRDVTSKNLKKNKKTGEFSLDKGYSE